MGGARVVVKVGSSLLTAEGQGLDRPRIRRWVDQIAAARQAGAAIVLVSSGSIAEGMRRLGWSRRPTVLHELQAAAAVGQMGLIETFETGFQQHGMHTAQILLTHDDFSDRTRYLNARNTLRTLISVGVVPVVNENDTVSTDEIRLGDNDTLAGLVANLVDAERLLILTDQEGLYTADPRRVPGAELVREGRAGDVALDAMAEGSGLLGRGGMRTKLQAARLAARSGTETVIASGKDPEDLARLLAGEHLGTRLAPGQAPIAARKRWLAGQLKLGGRVIIDEGAARVLRQSGRSLLPVGVKAVDGAFRRGALVACIGPDGREVARGLANYAADEVRRIQGLPSERIAEVLGYPGEPELIHRDNLVVTQG